MATYQQYLNELPSSKVVKIRGGDDGGLIVLAPLPAEYGYTVGSEYSAPFDVSLPAGVLQKSMALSGISQKIGIRMQNMYSNPVPTEISVDLEFNAFYDARKEVVEPVINLAQMSLGTSLDDDYLKQIFAEVKQKLYDPVGDRLRESWTNAKNAASNIYQGVTNPVSNAVGSVTDTLGTIDDAIGGAFGRYSPTTPVAETPSAPIGAETPQPDVSNLLSEEKLDTFNHIMEFLGVIRGPAPQILSFGNFLTISDAYLTSISPRFSNVLDKQGFPMSCTCSVTFTLGMYPIAEDVATWHGSTYVKNSQ